MWNEIVFFLFFIDVSYFPTFFLRKYNLPHHDSSHYIIIITINNLKRIHLRKKGQKKFAGTKEKWKSVCVNNVWME